MKNVNNKKNDVQVLLSIMDMENYKQQIRNMNVYEPYFIVNQIRNKSIIPINIDNKVISLFDKGLSKSRNIAIKHCTSKIALISDDDMYYYDGYQKIISDAYNEFKDADLIAFAIDYEDKNKIKKRFKKGRIGYIKALKISSVQITFKKDSILNNNIIFDEMFGSGSIINFGEDNIFTYDCLKKHLKIYYIPLPIGKLREEHASSWFDGYNKNYFKNRGAIYYRMSKLAYPFLILQFAIRKRKKYSRSINFINAIKFMFAGAIQYKNKRNLLYE